MAKRDLLDLIEEAKRDNWTRLDLSAYGLEYLPAELFELTALTELNLHNNQLTSLPAKLGKLTALTKLALSSNQLSVLPAELFELTALTELNLSSNQLSVLPAELFELTALTELNLHSNQLSVLPAELFELTAIATLYLGSNLLVSLPTELGKLTALKKLYLHDNQLASLPVELFKLTALTTLTLNFNQLTSLPAALGKLTALTELNLHSNQLTSLPAALGKLMALTELNLHNNQLTSLPAALFELTALTKLDLSRNQLSVLPAALFELTALTGLNLDGNQLSVLPAELGRLTALKSLNLAGNQLAALPAELGQLTQLTWLNLTGNQLTSLPSELGYLEKLDVLGLENNPLADPPPEIIRQGKEAVRSYLLAKLKHPPGREWVSKLLVVGEGGTGKTSLLRALRGEAFVEGESTTRGIAIQPLDLKHPEIDDVSMRLNAWDFGGQEIYHATHQFFLTNRSLFVVVWNARLGYEQGKLYYWLDTIQAKAPNSPVLVVAAHVDERIADLPQADLKRNYPQIVDFFEVSNKAGTGIEALREAMTRVAAGLPLMGETWPSNWLAGANALRSLPEKHITPSRLREVLAEHGVEGGAVNVLARWMHELGDILYFQDDDVLNDLVILKPQWVTEVISRVLECERIAKDLGIYTRDDMTTLWADIGDPGMRDHLLRLMERFDLSYQTKVDGHDISLVVELLQWDEPSFQESWDGISERKGAKEIVMRYRLGTTLPAGIPTWFIARSHRFTTRTHWRLGALFADGRERIHLGLIRAFPHERTVELIVRGPAPQNFFALLRDGLEVTLARFPGLKLERKIPCPGHGDGPCKFEFDYNRLLKTFEQTPPIERVQCQESYKNVSVLELLFGIHWQLQDEVLFRLDELRSMGNQSLDEIRELRAQVQREFLRAFSREQSFNESECPGVFTLRPLGAPGWQKRLVGQKAELQLYCNAPGKWHSAPDRGRYEIDMPAKWLKEIGPYVRGLVKVLKYAAPLVGPVLGVAVPDVRKPLEYPIKLMEELVRELPDGDDPRESGLVRSAAKARGMLGAGPELRALRQLLDRVDPDHHWGGLRKILTPEHDYLWLCPEHAAVYTR